MWCGTGKTCKAAPAAGASFLAARRRCCRAALERTHMRLLLINPNISDSVSELIRAEAQRSAAPGTEITVVTAPFGVAYIETRFEALIGAYAAAQLAAEHG